MSIIKIMPCLDMKDGRVVEGVQFVDIRGAGDPAENAAIYQREGADELAMLDIATTVENRKRRVEWVRRVSASVAIPLLVSTGALGDSVVRASYRVSSGSSRRSWFWQDHLTV